MGLKWVIIFLLLPLLGSIYIFVHTWKIAPSKGWKIAAMVTLVLWFLTIPVFASGLDRLPYLVGIITYKLSMSWIFIILYAVMLFFLLDLGRLSGLVPKTFTSNSLKGSLSVLAVLVAVFTYSYINYSHKARKEIDIVSEKYSGKRLKIVMLSDLHLGYNIRKSEFEKWQAKINSENADLILIGGDIIDGSVRPLYEDRIDTVFRNFNAPVYTIFGNHEYYTGIDKSRKFFEDAGIVLIKDSILNIKGIQIIGRDDFTNKERTGLSEICKSKTDSLFSILLDHQPQNLSEAMENRIDFQFSGHTHYGQVWPISWIEKLMYEKPYGEYSKGETRYYISSGMGIWGPRFRIGTKSEYLVLNIKGLTDSQDETQN